MADESDGSDKSYEAIGRWDALCIYSTLTTLIPTLEDWRWR